MQTILNSLMLSSLLEPDISNRKDVHLIMIIVTFFRVSNSVDPDQTPRSDASNLGLHCLPMFLLYGRTLDLNWLRGLDTFGAFSAIIYKGDKLYTSCLLTCIKVPSERECSLKERIFLQLT